MQKFLNILVMFIFVNCSSYQINEKVLICGVCKNVASSLHITKQIIEKIGSLFEDYKIIVYENNSTDNTVAFLRNWENQNSKVNITSEFIDLALLETIIINRQYENKPNMVDLFKPEAIAIARNKALDIAMSSEYNAYEYIIWIDMDFKYEPDYDAFKEVFEKKSEWDAVFAYGIAPNNEYWDWYALRDAKDPLGPELLGWDWYTSKVLSCKKTDSWHSVYSAFGGCGIYKKSSIIGCKYSGLVTKDMEDVYKNIIEQGFNNNHPKVLKYLDDIKFLSKKLIKLDNYLPEIKDSNIGFILHEDTNAIVWRMNAYTYNYPSVCEHVPFHFSMIKNGHDKLFINPRLIFRY